MNTPNDLEPGWGSEGKRSAGQSPEHVQDGNARWWNANPMAYDWHGEVQAPQFSLAWFSAIDRAHLHGARLFATKDRPFDRVMPIDDLAGKSVLEIGCGMGLHTETLARAGANVTAIDLTPTGVEGTTRRLALKGLTARVIQADAEKLPFDDKSFDFVWSWGVIHHSSNTGRVVRHIARVLRPAGECRIMVYNRQGMAAKLAFLKDHIIRGGFLRQTFEETLYRATDGFSARYYIAEQFEDLFRTFFGSVTSEICGQESDAIPLPRQLRQLALPLFSHSYLQRAQAKRGAFIFLKASRPT
jgi:2-polyprenyl-3-methyl-5-hydroxy-6-metoxy-1,4-benzoquinol methylase